MTRLQRLPLLAAIALVCAACKDDKKQVTPPTPTRITLNTAAATLVEGDSVRLTWTLTGFQSTPEVTLTSSNTSVATVASSGWVRGLAPGSARIIARAGTAADTADVQVTARPVALAFVGMPDTAAAGSGEVDIRVRVADTRDDGVAGVGVRLTPLQTGATALNATTGGDGVASFAVTVPTEAGEYLFEASVPTLADLAPDTAALVVESGEAASLAIAGDDPLELQVGDTTRLTTSFTDAFGNPAAAMPITWVSSDEDVATVDGGLVEATGEGTASILAIAGVLRDSVRAVVTLPPPSLATIVPASASFTALLDTVQFSLVLTTPQGDTVHGQPVTWNVLDAAVATVDAQGRVVARATGTTRVIGTSGALSDTAEVTVTQVAASTTISPNGATLNAIGATAQFSAEVRDANNQVINGASVTWSSLDAAVATVNASGLVTAAGNGTARIVGASGGVADTVNVTVTQAIASVDVTPDGAALDALGATVQLSASVTDANGQAVSGASVSWSSLNAPVATVSSTGLVTAVANGTADIVATANGHADTVTVTVQQAVASIEISPSAASLGALGETTQYTAIVRDANGSEMPDAAISWSSLNEDVVSVDGTGLVTAVGNGATQVIAASGALADTASVTVAQVGAAVTITVPADTMRLEGETQQLAAAWVDANGYPVDGVATTWSSSADSIVSVDASGLVTAGPVNGTAFIRASSGSVTDSVAIVVRDVAFVLHTSANSGMTFNIQVGMFGGTPATAYIYSASGELLARQTGPTITYTFPAALDGTVKRVEIKANRAQVQAIEAAQDSIVGGFPEGILDLPNLAVLNLAHNPGLTGALPDNIGVLGNLAALELFSTGLSGPLPASFQNLTRLDILNLSDTQLSGPVTVLENFTELWFLNIGSTNFSGTMPDFTNFNDLVEVYINGSGISAYSTGLAALSAVETIDFSDANLPPGDIERILQDVITSVTAVPRGGTLNLGGANSPPSPPSLDLVTTLEGLGWTVTVAQ